MYRLVRRILSPIMTVGLLSACVSNSPPLHLAGGESIAIQPPLVQRVNVGVDSKLARRSRGTALATLGAVGGTAVGAVGGAVFGLVSCGPAALVCMPLSAVGGAGLGLVAGGGMGAATGRGGISGKKATEFNEVAGQLIDRDRLGMSLHETFTASASSHWILEDTSPNTVKLVIRSLRFVQEPGDIVQLVLDIEMRLDVAQRSATFEFKHVGELQHVDDWLANDGERFHLEVNAAIENVTREMITGLVSRVVSIR